MITQLYRYHLYKFTPVNIAWYEFLLNWKEQQYNIIELYSILIHIYPKEYQFKEREFHVWKALLHSIRYTNIMPFDKNESEVKKVIIFQIYYLFILIINIISFFSKNFRLKLKIQLTIKIPFFIYMKIIFLIYLLQIQINILTQMKTNFSLVLMNL